VLRWRGTSAIPDGWAHGAPGGSVVTIGVFDGVHRGHQLVIGRLVTRARELGVPAVVITFDPHPSEVVRPGSQPPLLSTQELRADLLERLGVDAVLVLPFTLERCRQEASDFVREVLVDALGAKAVVVGENFRYGHRAAGNLDTLRADGERYGFEVDGVAINGAGLTGDADAGGDQPFSSTRVRALVAEGDVATAAELLGRPHRVEGVVVRGDQRGRTLGFPTANLDLPPHTAVPADGVYAGYLVIAPRTADETRYPAAISVGTNPTFDGTERRVEAYALDRDDLELYGESAAVEFVARVRGQERFDSVDALVSRMTEDVKRCRELLDAFTS
jgi:riboflavin kinase/FMN adenylyltransferase